MKTKTKSYRHVETFGKSFLAGTVLLSGVGSHMVTAFANTSSAELRTAVQSKIEASEIAGITAKSFHGSTPVANVWDNNLDTYVDSDYNHPVTGDEIPQYFVIELKEAQSISKLRLYPRKNSGNGRPSAYTVSVSIDGNSYTKVAEGSIQEPNTVNWKEITFQPAEAKYIKIDIPQTADSYAAHVVTVAELEVYKEASFKTAKEELADIIAEAESYKEEDYTTKSWTAADLSFRISNAKTIYNREGAGDDAFLLQVQYTRAAINKLIACDDVDYAKMKALVDAKEPLHNNAYTTASWRAFKGAVYEAKQVNGTGAFPKKLRLTQAEYDEIYRAVLDAEQALQDATDLEQVEYGEAPRLTSPRYGGIFEVLNEEKAENGVTLTVQFLNNGLSPEDGKTQKSSAVRSYMDSSFYVQVKDADRNTVKEVQNDEMSPLQGKSNKEDGVVFTVTLPNGEYYFDASMGPGANTTVNSAGYYRTASNEKSAKEALADIIAEAEACKEEAYTTKSWNAAGLSSRINSAKIIYSREGATDEDYRNQVKYTQEAMAKLVACDDVDYAAMKALADEKEPLHNTIYTTESWRAFKAAVFEAKQVNGTGAFPKKLRLTQEEYDAIYNAVLNTEKDLQDASDMEQVEYGSAPKLTKPNYGGIFKVTKEEETSDGVRLQVEFRNNGVSPEDGKTGMRKASRGWMEDGFRVRVKDKGGKTVVEVNPEDMNQLEDARTKETGVQFHVDVAKGEYYFEVSMGVGANTSVSSAGYYRTAVKKEVPVTSITLGDINKKMVHLAPGSTLQLEAVVNADATNKELVYETNKEGLITVDKTGKIKAITCDERTGSYTQVKVSSASNPDVYTYVNIKVPLAPTADKVTVTGTYSGMKQNDTIEKTYKVTFVQNTVMEADKDNPGKTIWYDNGKEVFTAAGRVDRNGYVYYENFEQFFSVGEHRVKAEVVDALGRKAQTKEFVFHVSAFKSALVSGKVSGDIKEYAGNEEAIIIPDTLNGKDVTRLVKGGKGIPSGVKSVIIPAGIQYIDAEFFANATDLEHIEFKGALPEIAGSGIFNNTKLGKDSIIVSEDQVDVFEQANIEWINGDAVNKDFDIRDAVKDYTKRVSGTILDKVSGQPISHAKVQFKSHETQKSVYAVTDDNGFYELAVKPGEYIVYVAPFTKGDVKYLGDYTWKLQVHDAVEKNITLQPVVTLTGIVRDEDGKVFKNASIAIRNLTTDQAYTVKTDENGRYALADMNVNDSYRTYIWQDGSVYTPASTTFKLQPKEEHDIIVSFAKKEAVLQVAYVDVWGRTISTQELRSEKGKVNDTYTFTKKELKTPKGYKITKKQPTEFTVSYGTQKDMKITVQKTAGTIITEIVETAHKIISDIFHWFF